MHALRREESTSREKSSTLFAVMRAPEADFQTAFNMLAEKRSLFKNQTLCLFRNKYPLETASRAMEAGFDLGWKINRKS